MQPAQKTSLPWKAALGRVPERAVPSYIVKEDQVLISISDKSLDFIIEKHLSSIFSLFYDNGIRVIMMHNSAVSFSVCVDNDKHKIHNLMDILN